MGEVLIGGLGGPVGFGPVALPRDDDGSHPVDLGGVLSHGLTFGGQTWTSMWVNTNGTLSFGAPLEGYDAAALAAAVGPVVAVFAADVDTRLRGEGVESGQIWLHEDPGTGAGGVLTITWAEVGFFRRNTDLVNSFQVRVSPGENPGEADFELRYGAINWVAGDLDGGSGGLGGVPALAGFQPGPGQTFLPAAASGNEAEWLAIGTPDGLSPIWTIRIAAASAEVVEGTATVTQPPPQETPPPDVSPPPPEDPAPPPPPEDPPPPPPPEDPPPQEDPPQPEDPPPSATSLGGTVRLTSGTPAADVVVTLSNGGEAVASAVTASDGTFVLPETDMTGLSLMAFANGTVAPGVTAIDALEVLKIVAQITPISSLTAADLVAADFDGDGTVTALDALAVLMHVAQIANAMTPRWAFIAADPNAPATGLQSVPQTTAGTGIDLADYADGGTLDLTMIAVGALSGQS